MDTNPMMQWSRIGITAGFTQLEPVNRSSQFLFHRAPVHIAHSLKCAEDVIVHRQNVEITSYVLVKLTVFFLVFSPGFGAHQPYNWIAVYSYLFYDIIFVLVCCCSHSERVQLCGCVPHILCCTKIL